jgi:hypothetical protein
VLQAIEFVQMQRDDELWELLISLALGSANMTGEPLAQDRVRCRHFMSGSLPNGLDKKSVIIGWCVSLFNDERACDGAPVGALLDHIGGYVDPLRLVQRIPAGLEIPRLRDRLVHIIADFRTQTSLREGCNTILHHDCLSLAQVRLFHSCIALCSRTLPPHSACAQHQDGILSSVR